MIASSSWVTTSQLTTTCQRAGHRFSKAPIARRASGSSRETCWKPDRPPAAACSGLIAVVHLAANADVRFGTEHPKKDLEQNTIATFNVLEAMRQNGIPPDRFRFDGLGLRRAERLSDAGRRAVPDPDVSVRRVASWPAKA